jgi:hypothetical protein
MKSCRYRSIKFLIDLGVRVFIFVSLSLALLFIGKLAEYFLTSAVKANISNVNNRLFD